VSCVTVILKIVHKFSSTFVHGCASLGGYDSDSFYNVFMSLSVKSANCEAEVKFTTDLVNTLTNVLLLDNFR